MIGVRQETIRKWLATPDFRAARVAAWRDQLNGPMIGRMIGGALDSLIMLRRLALTSKDEQVRVRAASVLLDKGEKLLHEHPDFQPEQVSRVPMFILPAGSDVFRMLGVRRKVIDAQVISEETNTHSDMSPHDHPLQISPEAAALAENIPAEPVPDLADLTDQLPVTQEELEASLERPSNVLRMPDRSRTPPEA
jgi:hypothetical protein